NDHSVGFLPNNITSDKLFQRVFGHHIFDVQRAEQDDTYITKHGSHHDGKVHYEFNYRNYCLQICERHAQTNDIFELIPPKCFEDEQAEIFVSNYSHWWNDKTKIVEFRPVHFQHENFLHDIHYILAIKKGFIRTNNTENRHYLINRSSSFFKNLFTKYFIRLDSEPYVYMLAKNGIINIHLSRLGIAFKYTVHNTIQQHHGNIPICMSMTINVSPTDSPTGWLYLALLHAITSHCLPDQYTGMTGMERSFELLNSTVSWSDQPFDPIESGIIELFLRFETFETNLLASSYDDLDEELTAWLKNAKMIAPIVERFRMLYNQLCFILTFFCLE
ncbi:unnamed protein product, partial [Rotaria socialis]